MLTQQEIDRIAGQALASGMRPSEILGLLDTFQRWASLGYSAGGNPSIDASVASLFAPDALQPVPK